MRSMHYLREKNVFKNVQSYSSVVASFTQQSRQRVRSVNMHENLLIFDYLLFWRTVIDV